MSAFIWEVYEEQFYNERGVGKFLSQSEMAGEEMNDNFAAFAYWKSNIEKYKIYVNLAEESVQDLKKRTKWVVLI